MRKLEVIVLNAKDSIDAQTAGADRLELVSAMSVGGLSPTIEIVKSVVESVSIPVNVMVRFKSENFVYDSQEFKKLIDYIEQVKDIGINGIVFGSLDQSGKIDMQQLQAIVDAAGNLELTFHRAIDESVEYYEQNIQAIDKLVTNVLTSGGIETPIIENVERLQSAANHQVRVLVGGGINHGNYHQLFAELPNVDFHVGSLAYNQGDFTSGINRTVIQELKAKLN